MEIYYFEFLITSISTIGAYYGYKTAKLNMEIHMLKVGLSENKNKDT